MFHSSLENNSKILIEVSPINIFHQQRDYIKLWTYFLYLKMCDGILNWIKYKNQHTYSCKTYKIYFVIFKIYVLLSTTTSAFDYANVFATDNVAYTPRNWRFLIHYTISTTKTYYCNSVCIKVLLLCRYTII